MNNSPKKLFLISTLLLLNINFHKAIASENDCSKTAMSGLAMAQCSNFERENTDKQVDAIYKKYLEKIQIENPGADGLKKISDLKKSQQNWKLFQAANCEFMGEQQGGSNIWISNFTSQCLIQESKSRISFFEKISKFNH